MPPFPMVRSRLTYIMWPFVRGEQAVRVDGERISLKYGMLGGFDIDATDVTRIAVLRWPWWAGWGVRIGYRMVAFTGHPGRLVLLELGRPTSVKMPFSWTTQRIALGVRDADAFIEAVAGARTSHGLPAPVMSADERSPKDV